MVADDETNCKNYHFPTYNSIRDGANTEKKEEKSHPNEGEKLQQYLSAALVSIGALLIGTTLAWTSPALKFLVNENYTEHSLRLSDSEANWVAALTPVGSVLGAIPGGIIADYFGRKKTLAAFCVPGIAAWLLKSYTVQLVPLYVARIVTGIVVGIFASVVPIYAIEIAEVSVRGAIGSFFEIILNAGILVMDMLGYFDSYHVLCDSNAALCALYLLCLMFIPESPTYLVKKNKMAAAEKSLRRLRGPKYDVQNELVELRSFLADEMEHKFTFDVLRRKANVKAMIIAFSLVIIQQFTAIDVVIAYAETIFVNGRVPFPTLCTILLGATQLIFTIVSSFIVDHVGRKILLVLSSSGTGLCLAALGFYFWTIENNNTAITIPIWLMVVSLVIFMIMFAMGLGPVVWLMCGEILGPEIKKFAFGAAAGFNLLGVTVVVYFFMPLTKLITTAGTFWMFSFLCGISTIFIIFIIPETKNKSLQQIQNELAGKVVEKVDTNAPI